MKQLLLICAAVALVGCGKKEDGNTGVVNPNKPSPKATVEKLIIDPIVEKAIRASIDKFTGELTQADYEKVTKLILRVQQLTDVPKELEKLTQLTELHLGGNQLTNVKGLEKLTQLTKLDLGLNQLTDVKGLEKCTQLVRLNLYNSQLTVLPKGLEKLTQLKTLWLYANNLTDVKVLEKLTKLESLYLDDNPALTKAQIAQLQKALPKCEIRSNPKK